MINLQFKSHNILSFLTIHDTQHPRNHNSSDADGETEEESEGKPTDILSQPQWSMHRESRRWSGNRRSCSSKAGAPCTDVEVAESVGWCSRDRGSRARDVVVNVESGWPVSR